MRIRKLLGLLLIALVCFGGLFTLSSCKSEEAVVKGLVETFLTKHDMDPKDGYTYTYVVVYNVHGNNERLFNKDLPSKYYKVTVAGYRDYPMYEGMFD